MKKCLDGHKEPADNVLNSSKFSIVSIESLDKNSKDYEMNENIQYILATITGLPGWAELIAILIVAVLLFGKRLPDIARSIGRSLTEFKKGVRETQDDVSEATNIEDSKKDVDQKPE